MSKVLVSEENLTNIANAIRNKNGLEETYTPSEMATAIENIETGGGGSDDWYITDARYLFYGKARLDIKEDLIERFKNITNMTSMFEDCSNIKEVSLFDTSEVTTMYSCFKNCSLLEKIPIFDTSKVTNFYNCFRDCLHLNDETLNNILAMCINATSYTGTKTLGNLGFRSIIYPATKFEKLPKYQAFLDAGWTIGY